ncbi:hypothetical protein Tmar_0026 [Thermaerobacter marianensis DSM 12885]|uniref:Uncharacterized protein n=1 Tax=Thermaerobacter marianensis (strain ATCC 700841 / DSM 12885 / JCM 10246 / 7p75a) TaxID=644966 RepID=E6SKG4_THEM7|nr:hypothetical protein [Thermaerobacter marianensis]ADU50151.1 hypothetical protein Tmar_0026 [Thermaerobacter marianensis DSM 12885]
MPSKIEHHAQVGDLVLASRTRTVWYQDRIERTSRWYLFRVELVDRKGRVRALREHDSYHANPVMTVDSPIYVVSRDQFDVDTAMAAYAQEHPEGFDSFEEAREFLRRFLKAADAKEG